jgi:hypothetical protein
VDFGAAPGGGVAPTGAIASLAEAATFKAVLRAGEVVGGRGGDERAFARASAATAGADTAGAGLCPVPVVEGADDPRLVRGAAG